MGKPNISSLETEALRQLIGTRCLSHAAVAIGTTKSEVNLAATVDVCIDGQSYQLTGGADAVGHTDTTVVADGDSMWFLISSDSAGTFLITQGTDSALPDVPDDEVAIGALKVVCDGAAFTPGTTLHDAAGVTTTFYSLSCLPLGGLPS